MVCIPFAVSVSLATEKEKKEITIIGADIFHNDWYTSSWWLQISWSNICARSSAATMRTWLWLSYHLNHRYCYIQIMSGKGRRLAILASYQYKDRLSRYGDFHYKDKTYWKSLFTSLYCDGLLLVSLFLNRSVSLVALLCQISKWQILQHATHWFDGPDVLLILPSRFWFFYSPMT